jgi:hypothetical protein
MATNESVKEKCTASSKRTTKRDVREERTGERERESERRQKKKDRNRNEPRTEKDDNDEYMSVNLTPRRHSAMLVAADLPVCIFNRTCLKWLSSYFLERDDLTSG